MLKVVVYHADANTIDGVDVRVYEPLFRGLVENAHRHGLKVIHLTLEGFPGWGDINHHYAGLAKDDIAWNREITWCRFLESQASDGVAYWLTEPDVRINEMFPETDTDVMLMYRNDVVPVTPSFRVSRRSGLPLFQEIRDEVLRHTGNFRDAGVNGDRALEMAGKDWYADCHAFEAVYNRMGRPTTGITQYNGMSIELRDYENYAKRGGRYVHHYKSHSKAQILC